MTEQQRPQPYDDDPRTSVDPHLLPPRHEPADSTAPASAFAPSESENASEPFAAPADSHSAPERDAAGQAYDPEATTQLDAAVARSRNITEDGEVSLPPVTTESSAAPSYEPSADSNAEPYASTADSHVDYGTPAPVATEPAASESSSSSTADAYEMAYGDTDPSEYDFNRRDEYQPAATGAPERDADDTASPEALIIEPDKRGNRGFAFFVAVLSTLVFAALYAFAFAAARSIFSGGEPVLDGVFRFISTAPFYVPVALYFVFLVVWSIIANRAGWWSYILASFFVAFLAAAGYYLGVAFQDVVNGNGWSLTTLKQAVLAPEHLPGALLAFIAARESALWIGGIAAGRGRRIKRKNAEDREEYERMVAEERERGAQQVQAGFTDGL